MHRTARAAAVVVAAVVAGCASGGEVGSPDPGRLDEMEMLDSTWDAYVDHRARMAAGDLSDERSNTCDDGGDCGFGFDVDGWYYMVEEVALDAALIGEPFVELGDGSSAHRIVDAEPALYLARVDGERRELMAAAPPWATTTRDRALELRSDRCSILPAVESAGDDVFFHRPRDCEDPSVRWLVDVVADRWDVDDPVGSSDPFVWRTEPIDPSVGEITGPSGAVLGPFDDPTAQLDHALERQCARFPEGACRVGYTIDERTEARVEATLIRQNVAEGSDIAYETTFVRVVFDRLADGRWWSTESGPNAIDRNGVGSAGLADADAHFDGCCEATAGDLDEP